MLYNLQVRFEADGILPRWKQKLAWNEFVLVYTTRPLTDVQLDPDRGAAVVDERSRIPRVAIVMGAYGGESLFPLRSTYPHRHPI